MRIKELREASGLTQARLGALLGVNQTSVAKWETGGIYPSGDKLPALAAALHCSIDALYGRDLPSVPPGIKKPPQRAAEGRGAL